MVEQLLWSPAKPVLRFLDPCFTFPSNLGQVELAHAPERLSHRPLSAPCLVKEVTARAFPAPLAAFSSPSLLSPRLGLLLLGWACSTYTSTPS